MKKQKEKELTEEELEKVVGGLQRRRRRFGEEDDGPTPTVGEAIPLPDPDFGVGPPASGDMHKT